MANEFPFFIKIQGVDKISGTLKSVQDRIKHVGKGFSDLQMKMNLGISLPVIGAGIFAVREYIQSLDALKQVQNGLANSGNKVGLSLQQIQQSAEDLQNISLFDDDQILRDVSNRLLVFQNISGKTFIGAQKAIVDIASKFGTELEPVAKAVGKALADPVHSLGALEKMMGKFSGPQKALIKSLVETNQLGKAQATILQILQEKFHGSAQAARDANPYAALSVDLHNLAEEFGKVINDGLIPIMPALFNFVKYLKQLSPEMKSLIVKILFFVAVIGPLLFILGQSVIVIAAIANLITVLPAVIKLAEVALLGFGRGIAVVGNAFVWLNTKILMLLANPVTWYFLAIALAIAGVVLLVRTLWPLIGKLWEQFINIDWVEAAVRKIGDAFNWLGDKIGRAWDKLTGFFGGLGRMKNFKGIEVPAAPSGFQVASVPTGSVKSQGSGGNAGNATVTLDFKNLPPGVGVKTTKSSNTNLNLNMGFSMVGFG